jgi:hypothetical protein
MILAIQSRCLAPVGKFKDTSAKNALFWPPPAKPAAVESTAIQYESRVYSSGEGPGRLMHIGWLRRSGFCTASHKSIPEKGGRHKRCSQKTLRRRNVFFDNHHISLSNISAQGKHE